MSTCKLKESQPILNFLAPTNANATSFIEPGKRSFNNPTSSRQSQFTGDGAFLCDGFISFAVMLDMRRVLFPLHKRMHISEIIALVCTQVLFNLLWIRTINNDLDDEIVSRPFVMLIRSGNMQREGCAKLIHQKMDFCATFASICRVFARLLATKGCRTHFAIHRLPLPANPLSALIEMNHFNHDRTEYPAFTPGLKPLMQRAATHTEPTSMDSFPLASSPQYIPDPVQHSPVIRPWPPRTSLAGTWKMFLDSAPQRIGYAKIVNIFRFCVSIFSHSAFLVFCFLAKISYTRCAILLI
jgi:hypothetical protein